MPLLTIGKLAKKTGLSTKTIRFYEGIGLIAQAKRAENGYRIYTETVIGELALIKSARELGFPIPEIRRLMSGCENNDCEHAKEYVEKEVTGYMLVLDKKIEQLQLLKTKLQALQSNIRNQPENSQGIYCCNIFNQLDQLSKGGEE